MSAPASTGTVRCPHCGKANRVPQAAHGIPRCGNCHEPLPWSTSAGDDDFADVVEKATLEQLAADRAGEVKLVKVDVDTAPRLSQRFGVQAVPTLMVLSDGQVIARQAGAAPLPALRTWLDAAVGGRAEGSGATEGRG